MTEPVNTAIAGASLITLAAAVFGPNAGPYIVIVLGSTGGGLWALASSTVATRVQGAGLLLRCVLTAIVLTALVATFVGPWVGLPVTEVYAGVAFVIGALGHRWQDIFDSIKDRLSNLISNGSKP